MALSGAKSFIKLMKSRDREVTALVMSTDINKDL